MLTVSYFLKLQRQPFLSRFLNFSRKKKKNYETVNVWKLVIFKKLQRSSLITVSYNRILCVLVFIFSKLYYLVLIWVVLIR